MRAYTRRRDKREHLVVQYDALAQDDGTDLVVADGQPGIAPPTKTRSMREELTMGTGRRLHAADAPAPHVEPGMDTSSRKEQQVVRE